MSRNRQWMYNRYLDNGSLNPDFLTGLETFIEFACSQTSFMDGQKIKCPFVLAKQAIQVYYCSYPSLARSKSEWWAVCKIKARSNVEVPMVHSIISPPLQEDELGDFSPIIDDDPIPIHPNGGAIDIQDTDDESNEEEIMSSSDEEDPDINDDDDDAI